MFPTAEAIREGVQIVEDDEWEEDQPPVPTDSEPLRTPGSRFPRPPSADGSFGASCRLDDENPRAHYIHYLLVIAHKYVVLHAFDHTCR